MKRKKIGLIFGILGGLLLVGLIIFAVISTIFKESDPDSLDRGTVLTGPGYVMLSAEKQNVTITAPGEYFLTGENKNNISVIVDSENVTLVLDDMKLDTGKNAGIINLTDKDLNIYSADGTTNTIFGGSPAKYNAPIYSRGNVMIGGNGTTIIGNRKSMSPMVLTEKTVSISDGTVVGLNIDKWSEKFGSPQSTLSIDLKQKIKRGDKVMISDEEGEVVFQFDTESEFEKIMVNSDKMKKGKYTFFDGEKELVTGVIE